MFLEPKPHLLLTPQVKNRLRAHRHPLQQLKPLLPLQPGVPLPPLAQPKVPHRQMRAKGIIFFRTRQPMRPQAVPHHPRQHRILRFLRRLMPPHKAQPMLPLNWSQQMCLQLLPLRALRLILLLAAPEGLLQQLLLLLPPRLTAQRLIRRQGRRQVLPLRALRLILPLAAPVCHL
jgi:hypothetical protein